MPFILILIGLAVLISTRNGTLGDFGGLLKRDIFGSTGQTGFIYWIVAVGVIGAIGYIKPIRPLANTFLVLVILVLFLSNGGFFAKFNEAIGQLKNPTPSAMPATGQEGIVSDQGLQVQGSPVTYNFGSGP